MTDLTNVRPAAGLLTGIRARIGHSRQHLSSRIHADGDDLARGLGWEIVTGAGRFRFGARLYRDPRFSQDRPERICGEPLRPTAPGPGHALKAGRTEGTHAGHH